MGKEDILVKMVMDGKKPGAFIDILENSPDNRLKTVKTGAWFRGAVQEPDGMAISMKGVNVSDVVNPWTLRAYSGSGIEERLYGIWQKIENEEVADALAYLNEYPRLDNEFSAVHKSNLERPEIAILEGHLFGYDQCCIDYYFRRNYLGGEKHDLDFLFSPPENPHILCYECSNQMKDSSEFSSARF